MRTDSVAPDRTGGEESKARSIRRFVVQPLGRSFQIALALESKTLIANTKPDETGLNPIDYYIF